MSGPQTRGTRLIQLLDFAIQRLDRLPHLLRESFDLRVCFLIPPPAALALQRVSRLYCRRPLLHTHVRTLARQNTQRSAHTRAPT